MGAAKGHSFIMNLHADGFAYIIGRLEIDCLHRLIGIAFAGADAGRHEVV
jgi:hypothetical protein